MCDTPIVIRKFDVINDTNADVNPTKGDIPTFTAVDVYNSAVVYVDDSYVLTHEGGCFVCICR